MKENQTEEMELIISKCLKIGVMLSAVIIAVGLVMFLVTGNSGYENNFFPTTPVAIFQGLLALKSYAIILTGLLLLIITPVFRVGVSILVYIKEKDTAYIIITSIVFAILLLSFLLGKAE